MCRFVAYLGNKKIVINDVIEKPENSLINQSKSAKEGLHGVNADGFGIAWYNNEIEEYPGIYKSIQPAWNDKNLIHLSKLIKSNCFLGHIRASTIGDVNQNNCHPFYYQEFAFVHNGTIRNFENIKRELFQELDEELFLQIKGNTDSESFFYLIMHYYFNEANQNLSKATKLAINWVVAKQEKDDEDVFSRLSFALTDGKDLIISRFVSKNHSSLAVKYKIFSDDKGIKSLLVASEALDDDIDNWFEIPENHLLHFSFGEIIIKEI